MAECYRTDTAALDRDTQAFREILQRLEEVLDGTDEIIASLHEIWEGTAREAFLSEYQKDSDALRGLLLWGKALGAALSSVRLAYADAEAEAQETVGS